MAAPPSETDRKDRFGGIGRLYGESSLQSFENAHVAVVGIGGVGSWTVEALARSGVGTLTLIDLDEICITNVNRQLHARDGEIGRLKIEAMAERARAINPRVQLHLRSRFYNEKTADALLSSDYDCVIDAIDSGLHKAHLVAECHRRKISVITCGAAGGRRNPTRITTSDLARTHADGLLLQLRKDLRNHFGFPKASDRAGKPTKPSKKFGITAIFSEEQPVFPQCDGTVSLQKPSRKNDKDEPAFKLNCASGFGSSSPVTGTFGLVAAAEALRIIEAKA